MTDHAKPVVVEVPANFNTVVFDFLNDLSTTFPEYAFLWKRWRVAEMSVSDQEELFMYFTKVFPERFFDILYQNEDIFNPENDINTAFLPNVEFKLLFHCANITENTKKAIWKYLQLILISVLGSVQNKSTFGDAANLFEGLDEGVIQEKLNETIESIGEFFKKMESEESEASDSAAAPDLEEEFKQTFHFDGTAPDMPNAEELHEHLKGLFDGKIGSLAKELAEEITGDMKDLFDGEGNDIRTTQDLLKKMLKNPKKMMDLMKNIGGKLQTKMKNGDISEEEIMREASEIMGKMKGMGGNGGFADIMKNMAQGFAGGKAKFDMGAFSRMEKKMSAKERMLNKMEQRREEKVKYSLNKTDTPDTFVFKLDEEEEQKKTTMRDIEALAREIEAMPEAKPAAAAAKSGGKKKKGKK
jgi:hypothetical protein